MPGRWNDARQPSENELNGTALVAISIDMASAKVRTGPPIDDETDMELPVWAGVLPIRESFGALVPDPALRAGIAVPEYLARLRAT